MWDAAFPLLAWHNRVVAATFAAKASHGAHPQSDPCHPSRLVLPYSSISSMLELSTYADNRMVGLWHSVSLLSANPGYGL